MGLFRVHGLNPSSNESVAVIIAYKCIQISPKINLNSEVQPPPQCPGYTSLSVGRPLGREASGRLWWLHWPYTVSGRVRPRGRGLSIRPIGNMYLVIPEILNLYAVQTEYESLFRIVNKTSVITRSISLISFNSLEIYIALIYIHLIFPYSLRSHACICQYFFSFPFSSLYMLPCLCLPWFVRSFVDSSFPLVLSFVSSHSLNRKSFLTSFIILIFLVVDLTVSL